MEKENKKKRYFYEVMEGDATPKIKKIIVVIFICIFLVSLVGAYLYCSKINYEEYNETYPEYIYEYLENVADNAIQNGSFYKTEIPEDVSFEFLEDGNLELTYAPKEINSYLYKIVTIQVSEKFEIQCKIRNISSADEFNKDLKIARVLIIFLMAVAIFCIIIIIGAILIIVSIIISAIHEKIDNKAKE